MLVAWNAAGDQVARLTSFGQRILLGVAMATGAVGSMAMAYQVMPGVYLDMRGPIIAVAAFFGGVPAAIVTAGSALAYRIYLGGAVGPGAAAISIAAAIGLLGFALRRARGVVMRDILYLAAAVSMVTFLLAFTLPAGSRNVVLAHIGQPILVAFVATALLGAVLLHEIRRRDLVISNRLYRSMVDALPDCLNIKDAEGRFLAANPATAALMQSRDAGDLVGKSDFDFYPAELAKAFRADELAIMNSATHATIEQPGQRPDGSPGWLSTLKAPILDDRGEIVGLVTHNRDITVQKVLQEQLAETQSYLDQALGNMNDGLAMYDRGGVVLFCNERYRELFPLTAHLRSRGSRFEDIISGSVTTGEEPVGERVSLADHIAKKLAGLRQDGEQQIELNDGRIVSARTKVLSNGCSLRVMSDVTERKKFERELEHLALHDPLTGLPNRTMFNRELDRLLAQATIEKDELVVMLIDLDRFKDVNDSFGHAVGDMLLVEVSRRLQKSMRRGDVAARLGGDEFAVLMKGPTGGTGDVSLASRIMKNLTQPLKFEDVALLPGGTIGYTVFPCDRSNGEGLLKNADKALYQAKARGRGTWKKYAAEEFQRQDRRA